MNSSCSSVNGTASGPPAQDAQFSSGAFTGQLNDMILNTLWLGALVPISIALVLTSSHLWKKPIFILNACAIACGFAFGGVNLTNVKNTLVGRPGNIHLIQAMICLTFFIPLCTQSILLIRILAVYPPRLLTLKKNLLIYGVIAAVLVSRIINMGFCFNQIISALEKSADAFIGWQSRFVRAEWFLQLFYDMYASVLFLARLREGGALKGRIGTTIPYSNSDQRSTYAERLRALFWIATSNFVFPTILNVVMIITAFRSTDPFFPTDLVMVNLYVEIVSVLLATIWCSGKYWPSGPPSSGKAERKANAVESLESATFAPPSMLTSHGEYSNSSTVFGGPRGKE